MKKSNDETDHQRKKIRLEVIMLRVKLAMRPELSSFKGTIKQQRQNC